MTLLVPWLRAGLHQRIWAVQEQSIWELKDWLTLIASSPCCSRMCSLAVVQSLKVHLCCPHHPACHLARCLLCCCWCLLSAQYPVQHVFGKDSYRADLHFESVTVHMYNAGAKYLRKNILQLCMLHPICMTCAVAQDIMLMCLTQNKI